MGDGSISPAPGGTSRSGDNIKTATPGPVSAPGAAVSPQGAAPKDFVSIAIERGYCTAAQIAEVRMDMQEAGITGTEELSARLVKKGVLTQEQARACERAMRGPMVIAGFEILEKVGQGGMGAVFRAKQISMDRVVALKILPPKLAQDPVFKQRFLHEARLSAKLSHLNIINGIDCGEAGGYTFFAMEFVDGKTVKQILKEKGKLTPDEAYSIMHQMAEALVYAEAHGLIHRDIKPDNIMMTSAGVAKLCDLGLAKQTEKTDDASLTQAGQAVGTPHFISPEQARGDRNVDTRSDIYSLGATFYNMVSGKTPFEAATGAAVMALHITDEAKNPCDLNPSVPGAYGEIISMMMAKQASDRYANAKDLLEDLDAAKAKRPLKASGFKAKSSCAMPKRIGRTGPQAPVSEKRVGGTARHVPAGRPTAMIAAAAAAVVVVAAIGYLVMGGSGEKQSAVPPTPPPKPVPEPTIKAEPQKATPTPEPVVTETKKPAEPVPPPDTKSPKIPDKPAPQQVTETKPPPVEPKPVEPPVQAVAPPPVVPDNAVSSVPVVTPPELPVPALKPTADMLYARFLSAMTKLAAKGDLQKLQGEIRDLSSKTEFSIARSDINAELKDFEAAVAFELAAMKKRADDGGFLSLNDDTAKKFEADKGKIMGFDPAKGFSVEVNSRGNKVWLYVAANALSLEEILKNSPDQSALGKIGYLCARGNVADATTHLPALNADKARWERKLKLMAGGETELQAQAYYQNLKTIAEAKSWGTYKTMAGEFDRLYSQTSVAAENIVNLVEWKAASIAARSVTEGLETSGKFVPVKWPNVNACSVKVFKDPDSGNTMLVLEGEPGAGLPGNGDKSAVSRVDLKPLNLTGMTEISFLARHEGAGPLQVCFGFLEGEGYCETLPVTVKPGDWYQNSIKIEGPVFKSAAAGYDKYDQELPNRGDVKMLLILVYTKDAYTLKIDKITLK